MSDKTQANNLFHIRWISKYLRQNVSRRALLKELIRHIHRQCGFTCNISSPIFLNYLSILRSAITAEKKEWGSLRFRHSRIDRYRISGGSSRKYRELMWYFFPAKDPPRNLKEILPFNCRVPVSTSSLKLKNVKDYIIAGRIRDNSFLCRKHNYPGY